MPGPTRSVALEAAPGQWGFASAPPDVSLDGVVVEYWEVEGRLAPFREKVLPNGAMEIMINLGPPHRMVTEHGTSMWDECWFSGLHEHSIVIESENGTHLVSARLHPVGALSLVGAHAARGANSVVHLEDVFGVAAAALCESLRAATSPEERFALLEQFILARMGTSELPSPVVRAAAQRIEQAHGNLRIAELHAELDVSRKHLSTLFAREVGMSPKAYAQIQRFVWTLGRLKESAKVDWSQLAFDAGYSDQSHLVRDFQRVAGANPTAFVRNLSPDSTALLEQW